MSNRAEEPTVLSKYGGWPSILRDLVGGVDLSVKAARASLSSILRGEATDAQVAGFIIAIGMKGGSVPELTGMVEAMMEAAAPLDLPDGAIDIVGSGGAPARSKNALNVSTMSCFVAAAAGADVCKHGSVAASSSSGSFDLLGALGINIEATGDEVARCMDETGIRFAFAKAFHPAMRHVGPVRSELGLPTTFNFLGPLSHPGGVKRQVIGVSDPAMAPRVAAVLAARNSHHALVVHGADRLDEITTTDVTRIYEVREGELIKDYEFDPRSVGIKLVNRADLVGGSPVENSEIMQRIFSGEDRGPRSDIIAVNAAAGLMVAGLADSFAEGVELSREVMKDGSANSKVMQVQAFMASVRD